MPPKKVETAGLAMSPEPTKSENLFVPIKQAQQRNGVKILLWGEFGSGKTYTALSFKAPVYVVSTEFGVTSLGHHFDGKDIRVLECSVPYTDAPKSASGEIDDQPFAIDPVKSLDKLEDATNALKEVQEGTIVIDSVSDVWAWLGNWLDYIAKKNVSKGSGKEYMMRTEWQKANAKYRWLMMRLLSRPCNVVLTSRSGPVYDSSGNVTMQTKPKAQQETAYYVDIVAKMEKKDIQDIDPKTGKITGVRNSRVAVIEKCRFADVGRLEIQDMTYDKLENALKGKVPEGIF